MNIFVTSSCPKKAARFLDDKRVVKMCLETAQILSTALRQRGYRGEEVYKPTHMHHPVVLWAGETQCNFLWTVNHLVALCEEYKSRYGKVHKCSRLIWTFLNLLAYIPEGDLTPFANCAANESKGVNYKNIKNVHTAYKLYLADRWALDKREPTWYGER